MADGGAVRTLLRRGALTLWRVGALAAAVPALGLCLSWLFPPVREVTTEVEIAATPLQAWAVLTDTAAYPAWNPDTRLVGRLQPGQVIEHDEGEGEDRRVFHPVMRAAVPGRELRWFGQIGWHLFDADHYFLLSPIPGGTRLVQGERLSGLALWVFDTGPLKDRFQATNLALKRRTEARPVAARRY